MDYDPIAQKQRSRGELTLGDLLSRAGIDRHDEVLAIRHTFKEAGLPSPDAATPESVLAYTRRQSINPLKFPKAPPRWWLVFLADGKRRSRLYCAYENRGEVDRDDNDRIYDLVESDLLDAFDGRLVVDWSADTINWTKRGSRAADFPVLEISDPERVPFPGFDRVELSYAALRQMVEDSRYESWRVALGSVQGIYLIADRRKGKLYVGKADGAERILGRWRTYAQTGHGGNVALKSALGVDPEHAEHFAWSILRVFGTNATPDEVDAAEAHFKRTLLSREFGYNRN